MNVKNRILTWLKEIDFPFFTLGVIWFVITFFTDSNLIDFETYNRINYIISKIIGFVILFVSFQFLGKVIRKKDEESKKYFKYFLIYFIPLAIILLLIWPGVWYGADVFGFLKLSHSVTFGTFLHYLTSLFYSVAYILFPVPSGAIILLMIYMSIAVSYIVKNTFDIFKSKWCYLMYVPFFLPVTIFYTLYANRPIMYGITYLLLFSTLIFDRLKEKKLSFKKILVISLLCGIAGNWRSEAIYLILATPLLVFISYKLKLSIKNICKVVLPIFILFIAIKIPQEYPNRNLSEVEKTQRNLPIYISSLSYMMPKELKGENIEDNLKKIDKVLDVENMKQYPSFTDTVCAWSGTGCIRYNYTMEEFKEFQKATGEVLINNFDYFLLTKTLTFIQASRIRNDNFSSLGLYKNDVNTIEGYSTTKPLFGNKVRNFMLAILEGRNEVGEQSNILYRLSNNLLIPLLFIGVLFIVSIFKKNLLLFLSTGMLIGHTFIVFITAPAAYFMYYYNIFLCGIFIGTFYIIKTLKNKKLNSKKN